MQERQRRQQQQQSIISPSTPCLATGVAAAAASRREIPHVALMHLAGVCVHVATSFPLPSFLLCSAGCMYASVSEIRRLRFAPLSLSLSLFPVASTRRSTRTVGWHQEIREGGRGGVGEGRRVLSREKLSWLLIRLRPPRFRRGSSTTRGERKISTTSESSPPIALRRTTKADTARRLCRSGRRRRSSLRVCVSVCV